MRIVIIGGGVVGFSLAEHLLRDGHTLSLVELDPHLCRMIEEKLDLQVVSGSGASPVTLREAGIEGADMMLAVTPSNEVNIVACSIAALHEVPSRIARLRGQEFSARGGLVDLTRMGITALIQPEQAVADHILQFMETPHAVESANFEGGRILLRGYAVKDTMPLAGKTLREIRAHIDPAVVLFAAIVRAGKGMIPDGNTRIEPGDIVYALFPRESLGVFLDLVAIERKESRKVIVTGDAFFTLELAEALERTPHKVTLVDPSREHAEKAAAMFNRTEVIHGDCTETDLLRELNVAAASFFIAASDEADYNVFSSLLAKAEGAREVIAVSTESRHDRLFNSIGIDHVVNPRLITAREILEIISRGHIGAVVKLSDVDIEAVRFTVEEPSEIAGQQVKRIARRLKKGSIIGVIIRGSSMILPGGDTVIEAGDHVIMISSHKNLKMLDRLFSGR
ncbi:MAG TPA: Trk system potassium transporter TrkA [candidate division Zixibacteria bacterium]|nr:Trk system potassium transporter TrkA [candidate division Zixibacteria bacterium]MDD4917760.1 Trk system potassium transporter TrkA [candidate division Zixibacteria bacterium]MDM7973735.1 Trk system potassium transporter TrkA [candidate division Zixibacteria bacterium]HOD67131.1 Trk system potassium transporter TrkA [candidate division Zixibacteria bacterium]HPI31726.1 Trk system potassium transporter TrkA [candidate division Zixibacteria bacterium]